MVAGGRVKTSIKVHRGLWKLLKKLSVDLDVEMSVLVERAILKVLMEHGAVKFGERDLERFRREVEGVCASCSDVDRCPGKEGCEKLRELFRGRGFSDDEVEVILAFI